MTLRGSEGFELLCNPASASLSIAALTLKYQNVMADPQWVTFVAGPVSQKALAVTNTFPAGSATRWRTPNYTSTSAWVQGMRLFVPTGGLYGASLYFLKFIASNGLTQVTLELFHTAPGSATYGMKAWRGDPSVGGAVLLGTIADAVPCDTWHYVECQVFIATSGGRVKIHLDGVEILALTGQNTNPAGVTGVVACEYQLIAAAGKTLKIDDMVLCDSLGSTNNDFFGEKVIEAFYPVADGAGENEWVPTTGTNHAAMVDDVGLNDGDTTALVTSVNDKREFFDVGSLAIITGGIMGVVANAVARISSGTSKNVQPAHRTSGGTEAYGTTKAIDSVAFKHYQMVMEVSPATGVAFTPDDITNGELGIKSVA